MESLEGMRYKRDITHIKKYGACETGNEATGRKSIPRVSADWTCHSNMALQTKYGDYDIT